MNNSFIAFGRHIWATKNRLTNYPGTGMDFRSGGFGGTIMPFDIYTPLTTHWPYFLKKKMTDESGASEKEGHGLDEMNKTKENISDDIIKVIDDVSGKNRGDKKDREPISNEPDGAKKDTEHSLFPEKEGTGNASTNKVDVDRHEQTEDIEMGEKEGGTGNNTSSENNRNSVSEVEKSLLHPVKVDKVQLLALKRKAANEHEETIKETSEKFKKKRNHKFNIV